MLQPVGHYLKLQGTHGAQEQGAAPVRPENLDRTLFAQLSEPQFELLAAHRVGNLDRLEDFRREKRQTGKLKLLAFRQRISQLERPVIGNPDKVTSIGNVEQVAPLLEKRYYPVGSDILIVTPDPQVHAALKPAR